MQFVCLSAPNAKSQELDRRLSSRCRKVIQFPTRPFQPFPHRIISRHIASYRIPTQQVCMSFTRISGHSSGTDAKSGPENQDSKTPRLQLFSRLVSRLVSRLIFFCTRKRDMGCECNESEEKKKKQRKESRARKQGKIGKGSIEQRGHSKSTAAQQHSKSKASKLR